MGTYRAAEQPIVPVANTPRPSISKVEICAPCMYRAPGTTRLAAPANVSSLTVRALLVVHLPQLSQLDATQQTNETSKQWDTYTLK